MLEMLNIKNRRIDRNIDVKLYVRRICLIIMDSFLIGLSSVFALILRFEFGAIDEPFMKNVIECLPLFVMTTLLIFWGFRIYHSLWEYISAKEARNIVLASGASAIVQLIMITMLDKRLPRSYYVLYMTLIAALEP